VHLLREQDISPRQSQSHYSLMTSTVLIYASLARLLATGHSHSVPSHTFPHTCHSVVLTRTLSFDLLLCLSHG